MLVTLDQVQFVARHISIDLDHLSAGKAAFPARDRDGNGPAGKPAEGPRDKRIKEQAKIPVRVLRFHILFS
jgi:hypothetical protein